MNDFCEWRSRTFSLIWVAALWAAILFAGCTQVDVGVRTRRDPDYQARPERLLVVVDFHRIDEISERVWLEGAEFADAQRDTANFSRKFVQQFRASLDSLGVASECYFLSSQDSSLSAAAAAAGDFRYDALLYVRDYWFRADVRSDREGFMETRDVVEIKFEANIVTDPGSSILDESMYDDAPWSALIGAHRIVGNGVEAMAEKMAWILADKMVADGLIGPVPK